MANFNAIELLSIGMFAASVDAHRITHDAILIGQSIFGQFESINTDWHSSHFGPFELLNRPSNILKIGIINSNHAHVSHSSVQYILYLLISLVPQHML